MVCSAYVDMQRIRPLNIVENKGNMTVTGDMGSLYMGGIAGYADNTTIQYCNNVADMTFWWFA